MFVNNLHNIEYLLTAVTVKQWWAQSNYNWILIRDLFAFAIGFITRATLC